MKPALNTVCIKIGGSTVDAPGFMGEFAAAVAGCRGAALPVVVHGGGRDIARELDRLDKRFTFVEGMRVTDAETLRVVQMVLSGDINKRLVNALIGAGAEAVGISGIDGGLITAQRMRIRGRDIGYVGTVVSVNPSVIAALHERRVVPVVSPVSRGEDGEIYNVNADAVAGELAAALHATDLVFVSDVPGVLVDGTVVERVDASRIEPMVDAGQVHGGMVPKLRCAAAALHKGVARIHICGWEGPDTIVRRLDARRRSGTILHM